jgi:hypothetical protein
MKTYESERIFYEAAISKLDGLLASLDAALQAERARSGRFADVFIYFKGYGHRARPFSEAKESGAYTDAESFARQEGSVIVLVETAGGGRELLMHLDVEGGAARGVMERRRDLPIDPEKLHDAMAPHASRFWATGTCPEISLA